MYESVYWIQYMYGFEGKSRGHLHVVSFAFISSREHTSLDNHAETNQREKQLAAK